MKPSLTITSEPAPITASMSDVEMVRRGYEASMRKRGMFVPGPMARANRFRKMKFGKAKK